ncbi:MAG: hypothetical protein NUV91_07180, partial [Candidatus Omnitrophica bacterium]|nr:hypothetical protein [Candidatus Omnitrophota bacterium]
MKKIFAACLGVGFLAAMAFVSFAQNDAGMSSATAPQSIQETSDDMKMGKGQGMMRMMGEENEAKETYGIMKRCHMMGKKGMMKHGK